jgi:diacylglycerol kinase family enzyme
MQALRDAGARVRAQLTADEDELAAVVRDARDRRLVLVGGDGTIHALANLGLRRLPPVALLPAGRANNIARALGVPVAWPAAAELAVRGRPAAVDALHVVTPERTVYAVEGVSAGFHAAARHRYTGVNSADLAAGVRALGAELRAYRMRPVALRVDGGPVFARTAAQVFLSNLPYFGYGFRVDPMADPSDGRLEAIVLEAATRRGVVSLLAAARDGSHLQRAGVSWNRGVRAHLDTPLPLVADAHPLGVTTAAVTVATGRLRIVTPERPR